MTRLDAHALRGTWLHGNRPCQTAHRSS